MRAEKQLLLDEIKEKIDKSSGFIALKYTNFTSARAREFRDKIVEAGGEFEVVRKRVFLKAAELANITFKEDDLEGHVGIAFAETDITQVAKSAVKYGEDTDQSISVLAGHIDGQPQSAEDVIAIAKLPSLPELRALFVGLLEAPMSQTVQVLNCALTGLLHCLEEKAKKD